MGTNTELAAKIQAWGITREAYMAAFHKLAETLPQQYIAPADSELREAVHGVVMLVIMQHLAFGFPLELPAAVIEAFIAWLQGGGSGEKVQCGACGYTLPPSFMACPLCGGAVGVGLFAHRRAAPAVWN